MLLLTQFKEGRSDDGKDQSLWSALQLGQREALSELFQRHHKHLYNYGLKIISDPEIVNEAIQELFLNLWNSRNRLSRAGSVKAYLLSSYRRLILKELKRKKNRAERNRSYIEAEEELTFPVEDLLIRKEVAQEKREQLQKTLQTITSRQKKRFSSNFITG